MKTKRVKQAVDSWYNARLKGTRSAFCLLHENTSGKTQSVAHGTCEEIIRAMYNATHEYPRLPGVLAEVLLQRIHTKHAQRPWIVRKLVELRMKFIIALLGNI